MINRHRENIIKFYRHVSGIKDFITTVVWLLFYSISIFLSKPKMFNKLLGFVVFSYNERPLVSNFESRETMRAL